MDQSQLQECSFTPDMPTKRKKGNTTSRDLEDFLMDQHRFLEVKQLKNSKVKQEMIDLELKEVKGTPQINKPSKK